MMQSEEKERTEEDGNRKRTTAKTIRKILVECTRRPREREMEVEVVMNYPFFKGEKPPSLQLQQHQSKVARDGNG